MESLKKKYAASDEKVYTVVTTVQVDDETEDEFTFLFKKPKAASYDRYVKTMSNSVTKASKSFAFDNIIDEQRDMLKARQQPQKRHTHQRDGAKKAAPPSIRLASL